MLCYCVRYEVYNVYNYFFKLMFYTLIFFYQYKNINFKLRVYVILIILLAFIPTVLLTNAWYSVQWLAIRVIMTAHRKR